MLCFKTYIQYLVLLPFVDLASQAAVSQGVLDDVLVGLGTRLLVQFGSCGKEREREIAKKKRYRVTYSGRGDV